MTAGFIDRLVNPASGNRVVAGEWWAADNAVYGGGYPGDDAYLRWLGKRVPFAPWCRFAVAPDVVGDAEATLRRSLPMLPRIRELGFPVAFVAQNGLEYIGLPWGTFDVLFIGGDTAWKLGPFAIDLVDEARERGKWVHMGRVNSLKRLRFARQIGCDSADGTYLARGPDTNLPKLLRWLSNVNGQGLLWEAS